MKYFPTILFVAGLLMEITAFFIGYADSVPIVYKFISPTYFHAHKGIDTLKDKRELNPQDHGFNELVKLFKGTSKNSEIFDRSDERS